MKFSVIMPSYLGYYQGAARDRHRKIHRAIQSVLSQSFQDFQLIVIADACKETLLEMQDYQDPRIEVYHILHKEKLWSGRVRNLGIHHATGDYIVYLDIDDYYGPGHLQKLADGMGSSDWAYYDDLVRRAEEWIPRICDLSKWGLNGTSNVCHKRSLGLYWEKPGYAHDWHFINTLKKASTNYCHLPDMEYYVCHIPSEYDY